MNPLNLAALSLFLSAAAGLAADWPPTLDRNNPDTHSTDGRTIERYTHGCRAGWNYPTNFVGEWSYPAPHESGKTNQIHNSFYVVSPKKPAGKMPLCVVLHSANRTAFDYLGFQFLNRKIEGGDHPPTVCTAVSEDCYTLFPNSTNREWWGWGLAKRDKSSNRVLAPPEKRVLDTLEWVVTHYPIDRNRIYLTGLSMGGCGTLGLGLPHGDVFAAIAAWVPAGTEYTAFRMGWPPPLDANASQEAKDTWTRSISAADLPDPPVVVDFSAQNDNWSKTQDVLLNAARAGHLALVLGWGPFGHTTWRGPIEKFPLCEAALAFPWLEIRKNAAYPVFTHATTDQRPPWLGSPDKFDESGQMNAWFRWKNQRDEASGFTIRLWLAHPALRNPPPMPESSTTDVTLRRLQRFKVQPGKTYAWQLVRAGKPVAAGRIVPDAANLLTVPKLALTATPGELTLKPEQP